MELWGIIKLLFFAAIITFGLRKWWESGFWLPKWLHFLSVLMFLVGFGLAKLATLSEHPKADLHQWFIVGFPLSVYVIFVLYGGASGYIRNVGDYLTYHASMKKDDVLDIFGEFIPKYINLPISDIIAIGESAAPTKILKGNKEYWLYIKSTKVEDEQEAYIPIGFWLEEHKKNKKYIPLAFTQIVYSLNGEILASPLEDIKLIKPSSRRTKGAH